jgi:hypothetical protein
MDQVRSGLSQHVAYESFTQLQNTIKKVRLRPDESMVWVRLSQGFKTEPVVRRRNPRTKKDPDIVSGSTWFCRFGKSKMGYSGVREKFQFSGFSRRLCPVLYPQLAVDVAGVPFNGA